jgi:hypothetical protein
MKAQEGLLAGTVGRGGSSESYVWHVVEFRRFTKCIKIAYMAVSCNLLRIYYWCLWLKIDIQRC